MSVPTAYLTKSNSAAPILAAIRRAEVPDKFTNEFLQKQLGFTSSSDRPVITVLKALRFLDESGIPLDRYRRYKDPALGPKVLAEGMRDAYSDVFAGDPQAYNQTAAALKGVFARISGKGDAVSAKMAATFKALAELADFEAVVESVEAGAVEPEKADTPPPVTSDPAKQQPSNGAGETTRSLKPLNLRHDVHVHLPASTDIAVYDAIFRSIKDNLSD